MKNNTLIYVGLGVAVLGAGFFLLRPKKDTTTTGGGGGYVPPNNDGVGGTSQGNQSTGNAILNIASGLDWNSILNLGGGNRNNNTIQNVPDSVPFETRAEGNAFRNWVNDNYPSYAQNLMGDGLDRQGSHTNSYITQAYKDYGQLYNQASNFANFTSDYIG